MNNKAYSYKPFESREISHSLGVHSALTVTGSGDILLTFSDFTDAMEPAAGYISRSTDGGKTFSQPKKFLETQNEHGAVHITLGMQTLKNGRIVCPYCDTFDVKRNRLAPTQFCCLISDNDGITWSNHRFEIPLHQFIPYGKIIELPDGVLLCPGFGCISRSNVNTVSGILRSYDGGESWEDYTAIAEGFTEVDLTLLSDGHITAFLRCSEPFMFASHSEDRGRTWLTPLRTNVTGQNFNGWITSDGKLIGVCRGIDGTGKLSIDEITTDDPRFNDQHGYGIHFFTAHDNEGFQWDYKFTLEDPAGRPYTAYHESGEPSVATLTDGSLLVAYYSYDETIFDTLDIESLPEHTRAQTVRIPHVFKRRICVSRIIETENER